MLSAMDKLPPTSWYNGQTGETFYKPRGSADRPVKALRDARLAELNGLDATITERGWTSVSNDNRKRWQADAKTINFTIDGKTGRDISHLTDNRGDEL